MLGTRYRAFAVALGTATLGAIGVASYARFSALHRERGAPVTAMKVPTPELSPPRFSETLDVTSFLRGNLHTHSNWSDGDKHPKDVYTWYRDHGYAFVALTDHDVRANPAMFRPLERPSFVIIAGEEITMGVGGRPVHVNGLCTRRTIGGGRFPSKRAALVHAVENVRAQGGVALVNHPNFDWMLDIEDVREARGAQLLEIWSGHPYVNTEGDAQHLSHEAIWDGLLSSGERLAGVAVDDTHHIEMPKKESSAARPGKGWVEVFGEKPDRVAICSALSKGWLYASSGVTLTRIRVGDSTLSVWPKEEGAVVEFIGEGGKLLESTPRGPEGDATYRLHGDERYVRARVAAPDGKKAWTQAYFVTR
jgi:hypothetical protein